ncbi:MAG TPA: hypothetical protein GX500_08290 [Firmicutes bacterium]|nr:hypothetical protein [Candidatus Fermentithermobacillaceae bacterium]
MSEIVVIEWDFPVSVEALFAAPYLYISKARLDSREEILAWAERILAAGVTEKFLIRRGNNEHTK